MGVLAPYEYEHAVAVRDCGAVTWKALDAAREWYESRVMGNAVPSAEEPCAVRGASIARIEVRAMRHGIWGGDVAYVQYVVTCLSGHDVHRLQSRPLSTS